MFFRKKQAKKGSSHIFKIRTKAPISTNQKPSSPDPSPQYIVENIQENESIILEDSLPKPQQEDQFSDLHMIHEATSRAASLDMRLIFIFYYFYVKIDFFDDFKNIS